MSFQIVPHIISLFVSLPTFPVLGLELSSYVLYDSNAVLWQINRISYMIRHAWVTHQGVPNKLTSMDSLKVIYIFQNMKKTDKSTSVPPCRLENPVSTSFSKVPALDLSKVHKISVSECWCDGKIEWHSNLCQYIGTRMYGVNWVLVSASALRS